MPAANYPLTLEQGASFRLHLQWNQPNNPDGTPGPPIDLTGCTAHMEVKKAYADLTPLVNLTDTAGITLGATTGTIDLVITDSDTAKMPSGRGVYDLVVFFPNGDAIRVLEGSVMIKPGVTIG